MDELAREYRETKEVRWDRTDSRLAPLFVSPSSSNIVRGRLRYRGSIATRRQFASLPLCAVQQASRVRTPLLIGVKRGVLT